MANYNNFKSIPFHRALIQIFPEGLLFFEKEIKKAGGFDELMIKKNALERVDGHSYIIKYQNAENYRTKFLTGKYRVLRPFYNTKVPYSFWSQLYMALKKKKGTSK